LKLRELLAAIEIVSENDKDMPMAMVKAIILLMIEDGRSPKEIAAEMGVVCGNSLSAHISGGNLIGGSPVCRGNTPTPANDDIPPGEGTGLGPNTDRETK